ncbi:hypothetical protein [Litchfieldia alkalitelluris]|uniref:hypothetical protein n=1 Tax=Litchfieldia alkalitelluris TaxID=304268 RepID=UPI00195B3ADD|nr:hypothetical protein [Litchfieldia alkalitelluris]
MYINAEENDISWVNDLELSLGNQYYEITNQAQNQKSSRVGLQRSYLLARKFINLMRNMDLF